MPIIDADTHIDETEDTWEYMQGSDLEFKPTTAYPPNRDPKMLPTRYWVIDGKRQLRFIRGDKESGTVVESRDLLDVQVRLKHMDELGTDIQVIYPTLFLMEATAAALKGLRAICAKSGRMIFSITCAEYC